VTNQKRCSRYSDSGRYLPQASKLHFGKWPGKPWWHYSSGGTLSFV